MSYLADGVGTRGYRLTGWKHDPTTPLLRQHIKRKIAQSVWDVEQQDQQAILFAGKAKIFVHTIRFRISQVRTVNTLVESTSCIEQRWVPRK